MWCCRAFAIACSMSVVSNIPLRLALLSVSTFVILLWSTHIECMIVDRGRALSFSCSRLDTATLIFWQCILIRIKLELQKQRWQWQCDSTVLHRGTLHSLTHMLTALIYQKKTMKFLHFASRFFPSPVKLVPLILWW